MSYDNIIITSLIHGSVYVTAEKNLGQQYLQLLGSIVT